MVGWKKWKACAPDCPQQPVQQLISEIVCIVTQDGMSLDSSTTVRNLEAIFDQALSFDSHIKEASRTAFFHLRITAKIRNISVFVIHLYACFCHTFV